MHVNSTAVQRQRLAAFCLPVQLLLLVPLLLLLMQTNGTCNAAPSCCCLICMQFIRIVIIPYQQQR
jgi:hypothetical protein